MPDRDRDQSIEQMLRRVMSDDEPSSQGSCLDGETFAAWSEGTLRGAEASAVEHHVAGCARCRALMAAFVRTTPAPPVPESIWRRWHLGWVVPLATAATAAALWVALPNSGSTPLPVPQEGNTRALDERTTAQESLARREELSSVGDPRATMRAIPSQQEKAKVAESVANEVRQRADAAARRELRDQQVPPAAPVAPPLAAAEPVAGGAQAPGAAAGRAAMPTAASPAPVVAERAEADLKKEAAENTAFAPLTAQRRALAANQIASPDGSVRWRIVNGRQVERSMDAGARWTAVSINAPDPLTAAAAPSATVCWIVGARGAVYLTTDGARFIRLPFTEMIDLTSVFATDALTASVSSADGRSWRTTDQGKTWSTTR